MEENALIEKEAVSKEAVTITVPTTLNIITFTGVNYVSDKLLYIIMRVLDMKEHDVERITFTVDNTPAKCFGRCYPDLKEIVINLENIWDNVLLYVKEKDVSITLRSGIWIQLLNTIVHEISHMNECFKNPNVTEKENETAEEKRCGKAAARTMVELAKTINIEMPDIYEMPLFGPKIMAEQLKYVNSNDEWAIKQYCLIEDKVVFDNTVNTAYTIREFYRFTAGADISSNIWNSIPEDPANGMETNLKEGYDIKVLKAQKNLRIHEEDVVRKNKAKDVTTTHEEKSDPPWNEETPSPTTVQEPPPPPPTTQKSPPPPIPAEYVEEPPAHTTQADEDSDFCNGYMDGSTMEGSMEEPNYTSQTAPNTTTIPQKAGRAYQDRLKKALPYSWEHNAATMGATFNQAYIMMAQHIFEKCGWNPGSAIGMKDENDIDTQMFDSKYCILEPVDLSHLPAAKELFVSFNSRNELGQTQFDLPCLQQDGKIIVKGEVFDKRPDSSQLPGYAVNINLYCEMENESGIKEMTNWIIQRLVLPQNPNKRYEDGSLKVTAQRARGGDKVAWVMKRGNFGDSKKMTHKITCVNDVWTIENL